MPLTRAAAFFGRAVALHARAYERGLLPVYKVDARVVSVGALETVGAGRTLFTLACAKLAAAEGRRVAVLHRDGGTEALVLARRLGRDVPVYAGVERVREARRAVADGADLILVDDGFQVRRLARDADIVLVRSGLYTQRLLPAGTLREPMDALRRATLVVEIGPASARPCAVQAPAAGEIVPTGFVPYDRARAGASEVAPVGALSEMRVLVVTAAPRPERIAHTVESTGARVADTRSLRSGRLQVGPESDAFDAVVTTEKDLASIESYAGPPLYAVRVEMRLGRGESLVRDALGLAPAPMPIARPRKTDTGRPSREPPRPRAS